MQIRGGATADDIDGPGSNDDIYGFGGNDTIRGGAGSDRIFGGTGNDDLFGEAGNDTLFYDSGDDDFSGGSGHDIFDLGSAAVVPIGNDLTVVQESGPTSGISLDLTFPIAFATPAVDDASFSVEDDRVTLGSDGGGFMGNLGFSSVEEFRLTRFSDFIAGNASDLVLDARGGNDLILAGAGFEFIIGGSGFDWVSYGRSTAGVSVALEDGSASGGFATGDTLEGIEAVAGSNLDDTLQGRFTGDDTLAGLRGDDTLIGFGGDDELLGGAGNDQLLGGLDDDTLDGGEGDDELQGGSGVDTLDGGEGDDLLRGGAGSDTLDGGAGVDTADYGDKTSTVNATAAGSSALKVLVGGVTEDFIRNVENLIGGSAADTLTGNTLGNVLEGNGGEDVLTGGQGDDTLLGGGDDDELAGGLGNDALDGGAGEDVLIGAAGNDTLDGGTGNDEMRGNAGDDIFVVGAAGDVVIELAGEGDDTVLASVSYRLAAGVDVETLRTTLDDGSAAIDLTGNGFAQTIVGNAGANTLHTGGGAADVMRGLAGDDIYRVFNIADVVVEDVGQGAADRVIAAVDYQLGGGVEVEFLTTNAGAGSDPIRLTGNQLSQEIVGNAGDNVLADGPIGGAADHLRGLSGNDTYRVFNPATTIVESSAQGDADRVKAAVDYQLGAGVHVEQLTTILGSATDAIDLRGNTLAQEIIGNYGDNVLHDGGAGAGDHLRGLSGNDTYRVFNSDTTIVESAAQGTADKVIAAVNYTLGAGVHIETLQTNAGAGTGNLHLTGNEFEQTIIGNNGDNRLEGKGGDDTLRGLGGNDTFVFADALGPDNVDTILDFDPLDDRFLLSNNVFSGFGERTGAILPGHLRVNTTGEAQDASDMIIYDSDDGFLYYDADGFGSGARIHFATIDADLAITSSDFVLA